MDLCRFLDWDSEFFAYRLASINGHQLNAAQWTEIQAWCTAQQIDGLYFLADSADAPTIQQAAQAGFLLSGLRMTMDRDLTALSPLTKAAAVQFRDARPEDVPALEAITVGAYNSSRFYNDPHFAPADCDRLYQTWIRRSCLDGFADAVLIAVQQDQPVAFMTCRVEDSGDSGSIPLVGVAAALRGSGLGQSLMAYVLQWFAQRQVCHVSVVVDGNNIPGQRLYQKCGFRTRAVQLWYHKWFSEQAKQP